MQLKNTKGDTDGSAPSKINNFILRTLSFCVLTPSTLYLLWKGGVYASSLIAVVGCVVVFEWSRLCLKSSFSPSVKISWFVGGLIYISLSCAAFWSLLRVEGGQTVFMILVILVLASDTGGYLFGIIFRGPKLAPKISPNKTWSGAFGAIFLTWCVAYFVLTTGDKFTFTYFWKSALLAILLSVVTQIGDLLESGIKRHFNVKDAGSLIPGHGGFLDRVDGLMAVGIILFLTRLFE